MTPDEVAKLHIRFDELEKRLFDFDDGLFARVKENTRFRKISKKAFWTIAAAMIGLISKDTDAIINIIKEFLK